MPSQTKRYSALVDKAKVEKMKQIARIGITDANTGSFLAFFMRIKQRDSICGCKPYAPEGLSTEPAHSIEVSLT